jgi:hypothetical protein
MYMKFRRIAFVSVSSEKKGTQLQLRHVCGAAAWPNWQKFCQGDHGKLG